MELIHLKYTHPASLIGTPVHLVSHAIIYMAAVQCLKLFCDLCDGCWCQTGWTEYFRNRWSPVIFMHKTPLSLHRAVQKQKWHVVSSGSVDGDTILISQVSPLEAKAINELYLMLISNIGLYSGKKKISETKGGYVYSMLLLSNAAFQRVRGK